MGVIPNRDSITAETAAGDWRVSIGLNRQCCNGLLQFRRVNAVRSLIAALLTFFAGQQ